MRTRVNGTIALAVAIIAGSLIPLQAGVIMISTRKSQDTAYSSEHLQEEQGPGQATPGDVAMAALLGDNGYSCRLVIDILLANPEQYLTTVDTNMTVGLVIWSGSSASADVPEPPTTVPLMMGEHVTLGNRSDRVGSIFMYNGQNSNDPNEASSPPATEYVKVLAPDHPIMKGIPLDAQGRVKIFREPYPQERARVPTGGKRNFEYRWCTQAVADKAAGTTILGVLDGAEDRACFAVVEKDSSLAGDRVAGARMVHMFTNEQGSGGSRRVFLALTSWGRILFVRAAQWAMGETLEPYVPLKITGVTDLGARKVKLSWDGSAQNNYRIRASEDAVSWQTVVDDIAGLDGAMNQTLDLAAAGNQVFFQVAALP